MKKTMKRIAWIVCLGAVLAFTTSLSQAQTDVCPADPVTGIAVAQMIGPTDGSTLRPNPDGSFTFTWCNASADYFVIVESVPGAHDIFFAFTGGAGGGAGQNFLTLGPTCNIPTATNPTTQCIPSNGETIYFTLETVKNKQILGSFQYTFTAPGASASQAATTISVGNSSATASASDQTVTLTATVAAASAVNQGAVTFQVVNGTANVGAAVTSATLSNGSASVSYLLPGGTAAASYTIQAKYSGGTAFQASSGSGTLTVNPATPVAAPTTTTVDAQTVTFSSSAQNITLTATLASSSAVNAGTVTFTVKDPGSNLVGSPVSSATLSNGSASAIFALPAGLAVGDYTVQAAYSGGTNFQASSGAGTLTVNAAPSATQAVTATTVGNNATTFSSGIQQVTLTASVSVPSGVVNQGSVIFQLMDGATAVGSAVPSATLTNGNASVSYALPARTAAKAYTIQTAYSGGSNFLASSGSGTLTITKAVSTTNFSSTAPASLPNHGTYTPTATSTGDGTLTIAAGGSCSIANGVVAITAASGVCTVTATESAGTNFLGSSATPQTITAIASSAPADYRLDASTKSLTIQRGQSGSLQITLTPSNGFDGAVTLSCSGLPAGVSCQFTPAQLVGTLDGRPLTTTLVVSASQVIALNRSNPAGRHSRLPGSMLAFWSLGVGALGVVFVGGTHEPRRMKSWKRCAPLLLACVLLLGLLAGCGGSHAATQTTTQAATPQSVTALLTATFVGGSQPAPSPTQQVQLQITILP